MSAISTEGKRSNTIHSRYVPSAHPSMLRNIYRLAILVMELFINHLHEDCRPARSTLRSRAAHPNNSNDNLTQSGSPANSRLDESDPSSAERSGEDGNGIGGTRIEWTSEAMHLAVSLKDLLPGDSESEKAMVIILKMSLETFEKLKVKDSTQQASNHVLLSTGTMPAGDEGTYYDSEGVQSEEEDLIGMFNV